VKYIVVKEGNRKRKHFAIICEGCNIEFFARKQRFCSRQCRASSKHFTTNCSTCGQFISRGLSKKKNSKHGFYFCDRLCKEKAQKLGGLKEIQPSHYGSIVSNARYREIAFDKLPARCNNCGYDKHKRVLVVHHKDRNRKNSRIDNLEILCPTCHVEEHAFHKKGK